MVEHQFSLVDWRADQQLMRLLKEAEEDIRRRCGKRVALVAYTDVTTGEGRRAAGKVTPDQCPSPTRDNT